MKEEERMVCFHRTQTYEKKAKSYPWKEIRLERQAALDLELSAGKPASLENQRERKRKKNRKDER
jgi:hypothetical protein